jgi:hypothetical protein
MFLANAIDYIHSYLHLKKNYEICFINELSKNISNNLIGFYSLDKKFCRNTETNQET